MIRLQCLYEMNLSISVMAAVAMAMVTLAFSHVGIQASETTCVAEAPCECRQELRHSKEKPDGFTVSVVDCSDKRFTAVPYFRPMENQTIDYVLLQNNQIAVVHTEAFSGLQARHIDLSSNRITTIEDDSFMGLETELKSLNLDSNRLFHLPNNAVSKLKNLETLDIMSNSGLRELRKDAFKGLFALRHLELGNCLDMFYIHKGAFESIRQTLRELLVHHCRLKVVPEGLRTLHLLERLRLPYNLFTKLRREHFEGLDSIHTLDLSYNRLLTLPDSFVSDTFLEIGDTLEMLDLTGIGMASIPSKTFYYLQSLKSLYLANNRLSKIVPRAFSPLKELDSLYLYNNPLQYTSGMFQGLDDSLSFIQIGDQNMTSLPLSELATLKELRTISASGNIFQSLNDGFTAGLSATHYHFGSCNITDVSASAFSGKSALVSVVLSNNQLTNLDFVEDPCYFWRIDVTNNPIYCDCFTYVLSKFPHLLLKGTCASPDNVKDLAIGGSEFDNMMYWRCTEHFYNITEKCTKWWVNKSNRHTMNTFAVLVVAIIISLYSC